jgi:hypothetical protein
MSEAEKTKLNIPSDKTLQQASKLSIKLSKPMCYYFYIDSLKKKCCIVTEGDDRILYKNDEEHTSPILNTYKSDNTYIIVTNHTIYLVSADTEIK